MIIFGLDGTLADHRHRLHYIEQAEPDWKSFYEACHKDEPIQETLDLSYLLNRSHWNKNTYGKEPIYVWTGRCKSAKYKTIDWFFYVGHPLTIDDNNQYQPLNGMKMRPVGDHRPEHELKEEWLKQALNEGEKIEYVFEDNPRVIEMYRSHGIFVFDCNQEK